MLLSFESINELKSFIGELGYVRTTLGAGAPGGVESEVSKTEKAIKSAAKAPKSKVVEEKTPVATNTPTPAAVADTAPVAGTTTQVPASQDTVDVPGAKLPTKEEVTAKAGVILNANPAHIGVLKSWLAEEKVKGISELSQEGLIKFMENLRTLEV